MSRLALSENNAVILFGFENRKKVEVSPEIKDLGLDLLRAQPDQINLNNYPDITQPRYGDYLQNLSAYCYSQLAKEKVSNTYGGYPIMYTSAQTIIPFPTIPLTMAWTGAVPDEVLEQLRNELQVSEGVSGGKPAIVFHPGSWDVYDKAKGRGCNIRCAAPIEHINIKQVITCRSVLAVISGLVRCHVYPAFIDPAHETNVSYYSEGKPDVAMQGTTSSTIILPESPFGQRKLTVTPAKVMVFDGTKGLLPESITYVDITTNLDGLPKGDGLWFPFFQSLANYDIKTVPEFLERYMPKSFSDELAGNVEALREIRADFGVIGKTMFGKMISHFCKVMDCGLRGQARVLPVFHGGHYKGAVMLGAGYTVDMESKMYRPVGNEALRDAIRTSNSHAAALESIAKLMGNKAQSEQILECKSMLELRNKAIKFWTAAGKADEILRMAAHLDFAERSWNINLSTLQTAMRHIKDPNFTLLTANAKDFPIHHSQILNFDTAEVVWSCFGFYAPSFQVPGGKLFHLSEEMDIEQMDRRTGRKITQRIVRIAVRQKPLPQALADLAKTRQSKSIMNPLVLPRVRTSQQNMDRLFKDVEGKDLLSALRDLCDIRLGSTSGKRVLDGESSEPAAKRAKTSLDASGW